MPLLAGAITQRQVQVPVSSISFIVTEHRLAVDFDQDPSRVLHRILDSFSLKHEVIKPAKPSHHELRSHFSGVPTTQRSIEQLPVDSDN